MSTVTYAVEGMTCGHCVQSVTAEVSNVPGVVDVSVDLAAGQVSVTAEGDVDHAVRSAVEEAGYEVRSGPVEAPR